MVVRLQAYAIGTVITSETVPSSNSVTVASLVNSTSVTLAVHCGFGQDPAGATGAFDVTVNLACPFLGVAKGPLLPARSVSKLWPGATFPAGLVHWTLAIPSAATVIVNVVPPRPATFPVHCT